MDDKVYLGLHLAGRHWPGPMELVECSPIMESVESVDAWHDGLKTDHYHPSRYVVLSWSVYQGVMVESDFIHTATLSLNAALFDEQLARRCREVIADRISHLMVQTVPVKAELSQAKGG